MSFANLLELSPTVRNHLKAFEFNEENREQFGFHNLDWLLIGKYKNKYPFHARLEALEVSSVRAEYHLFVRCGSIEVSKEYTNEDICYDANVLANIAIVPAYKYLPELVAELIEELEESLCSI